MVYIDLRFFHNSKAYGILNSIIGYGIFNTDIKYIVKGDFLISYLKDKGIDEERIVLSHWIFQLKVIRGCTIISPIQRFSADSLLLRVFGIIKLQIFVHDLHFLSKNTLLKSEFSGFKSKLKSSLYLFNILHNDGVLVFSHLVQRQLNFFFNIKSFKVTAKRVFYLDEIDLKSVRDIPKQFDYFIPLTDLNYKGLWALDKLIFDKKDALILVNKKYLSIVKEKLVLKNVKIKVVSATIESDLELAKAYAISKVTLCLSRFEGFGFMPYEAAFFNSIPVVLNYTSYVEIPDDVFLKIKNDKLITIPCSDHISFPIATKNYIVNHISTFFK